MVIRGAVFRSASWALRGARQLSLRCRNGRAGTTTTTPPHYAAWEKQYTLGNAVLRADDKPVTLLSVLARLD